MVDNTQSWQQQFTSYAEYANWYNHYYGQPTVGATQSAVPSQATLAHPHVAASTAAAAVAQHTPYYHGYIAAPTQNPTSYAAPPSAAPPPVAGL